MPEGLLLDPENLISFDEVIDRAKNRGVSFGKGNPYNRLRYYTKIGLLPHAKRKSFGGNAPTGAYPESVVASLIEIDKKLKSGKSIQAILRQHQEQPTEAKGPQSPVPKSPLENLPAHVNITPIPVIKPPPFTPKVQAPAFEKGPPYEPFVLQEPTAVKMLKKVKPVHYAASIIALMVLALPLLYFTNTGFRNASKDILLTLRSLNPLKVQQQSEQLALPNKIGEVLGTVSDPFLTVNVETDILGPLNARAGVKTFGKNVDAATGDVYASNLIYSISAGDNVAVSAGQEPTISVTGIVTGVSGVTGRTTSSGGTNPAIDIAPTYPGQTSISTLGTVSTGVWQGTAVGTSFGGTGQTTVATGDVLYGSAANVWSRLGVGGVGEVLTVSGGGVPTWNPLGSGIVVVKVNDSVLTSSAGTLDFLGGDFVLAVEPGGPPDEVNFQLATILTTPQGASGNWDVAGTLTSGTANAFQVDLAGTISIPSTETLRIGTIELNDVGVSPVTSGAVLVGTFDEFANSSGTNVQDVLDDLDAAIGVGASKWNQDTGFVYLTNTTDDVVIGGATVAAGSFHFDEDLGTLNLGTNGSLNGLLRLYSSGAVTDPTITTNVTGDLVLNSSAAFTVNAVANSTIDLSNAAARTLTITNSGAGVADLSVEGTGTFGVGLTVSAFGSGVVVSDAGGNFSSLAQLNIARGGTNASSFTTNSVVYYNGASLTSVGAATDGQVIIGRTGLSPVLSTLTGTAAEIDIANGAGTITIGIADPLGAGKGGTGVDASAAANGTLLIGNGTGLSLATLTEGEGIDVTNSVGSITIAGEDASTVNKGIASFNATNFSVAAGAVNTIQNIDTTATPTFSDLTLSSFTANSVLFAGAGGAINEDTVNFVWNDTTNRLGLGDNTPAATLTVGAGDLFQVAGASGNITTAGNIDTAGTIQAGSSNVVITLATGFIDADAIGLITADGVGGTSSGSGLETDTDRLGLLQGCLANEILKWNETSDVWQCAADAAGATGIIEVQHNGDPVITGVTRLQFNGTDFNVAGSPTTVIDIDYDSSTITRANQAETITALWGFDANLQLGPTGAGAGQTGELRFLELAASGTNYTGFKAPDAIGAASNTIYVLPDVDASPPAADMVLTYQAGDVLEWKTVAGVGAGGDITDVGDITTGAAFTQTVGNDGNSLWFEGTTVDSNELRLTAADVVDDITVVTIPAITGTLASLAGTQVFTGFKSFINSSGILIGEDIAPGTPNTAGRIELISAGDNAFSTIILTGTQTQNITYTLPLNDGSSDQVLTSNGAGVLRWDAPSGLPGVGDISAVGNVTSGSAFTGSDSSATKGNRLIFEGDEVTDDANDLTLQAAAIAGSSKTITLPDLTGTTALHTTGDAIDDGSVLFGSSGLIAEDPTSFFWDSGTNELGLGTASPSNTLHALANDGNLSTVTNLVRLTHNATGAPGAGMGTGIIFGGESSTTEDQTMAQIAAVWNNVVHVNRSADISFYTVDNANPLAEIIRFTSTGNIVFEKGGFDIVLAAATPTAGRTFTFPNVANGDVCISNIACIATTGDSATAFFSSGILEVGIGGTGATTFTTNGVLFGNGASAIGATAAGIDGTLLLGQTGTAPLFVDMSGDVDINAAGVTTIQPDSVALTINTTGDYIETIISGNGVVASYAGGITEGADVTLDLGSLTTDWIQSAAFDIRLDNASSELRILESIGGAFRGTIDVGDLSGDKIYVFPDYVGATTNVCLATGNCAGAGGGIIGSGADKQVAFFTGTSTISSEAALTYDYDTDRLGILTSSPQTTVDLFGESAVFMLRPENIAADTDTNNSPILRLRGTYDSDAAVGPFATGKTDFELRNILTGPAPGSLTSRLGFTFVDNLEVSAELVTIESGGNVGIGTASPTSFKLQVAGNVGPNADSTYDLGSSTNFWRNAYIDRVFLTSNIYLSNDADNSFQINVPFTNDGLRIEAFSPSNWFTLYVQSGTVQFNSNSNNFSFVGNIVPPTGGDSTYDFGTSSLFWRDAYIDRVFLNTTASLDGTTAGAVTFAGSSTDPIAISPVAQGVGAFTGTITSEDITVANKTWTFPDEAGTICLQSSSNCGFATGTTLWTDQTTYIEPNTIGANEFRIYDSGGLNLGGTSDPGSGKLIVSGVNAASSSADALSLTGTLADLGGSNTFRGLYLNYTNANHTVGSNVFNAIDIAGITADAEAAETAINIGSGWDNDIDFADGTVNILLSGTSPTITIGDGTDNFLNVNSISDRTTLGYQAAVNNVNTTALGWSAWAGGGKATSLGSDASATGTGATAVGSDSSAGTNFSTAIGYTASASGIGATTLGTGSAGGDYAISIGYGANIVTGADYSAAFGYATVGDATHDYAFVFGRGTTSGGSNQFVIGTNSSYPMDVGIQTNTPDGTLDIDPFDVTGATAEDTAFISNAQQITLADTTTIATQRQNQFLAPTLVGVAGGGAEQVTDAATVYIDNAPVQGADITITNSYALWVDAGQVRIDELATASTTGLCINSNVLSACTSSGGTGGYVELQPSSAQTTQNNANSLIWLNENQSLSPNLLELEVGGSDRLVLSNGGALTVGEADDSTGAIYSAGAPFTTTVTQTTLAAVDASTVGPYNSIAIGRDGYPVVSYYNDSDNLELLKCDDAACSGSGETINIVDTSTSVARTSLAIGTNGNPVIAYLDGSNLKVAECNDPACSGGDETLTTVVGGVNDYISVAIGTDGYPVVSFRDTSIPNVLKVAKKTPGSGSGCTSGDWTCSTADSGASSMGAYSNIAIGPDGLPIIAHQNLSDLRVVKCNDAACDGVGETVTTVVSGNVGSWLGIAIGIDGLPIIVYGDGNDLSLKVVECNDAACAGANETITEIEDTASALNNFHRVAIGTDGQPVISYYDGTATDLKVAKKTPGSGSNCTSSDWTCTTVDVDASDVGRWNDIAIGVDGLPVISYANQGVGDLKVARCATAACDQSTGTAVTGGLDLGSPNLGFRNLYGLSASLAGSLYVGASPVGVDNTFMGSGIPFSEGNLTVAGTITSGNILPHADDTYDLGSSAFRWQDLYLGPSTIYIGTSGDEMQISYATATDIFNIGDGTNSFLAIDDQGTTAFVGINKAAPTVALDVTGNMLVTSSETSGTAVSIVADSVDTGDAFSLSADALTTGAGLNITSTSISGDGGRVLSLGDSITPITFNPTGGGSQYGAYIHIDNAPSTNPNTAYGIYINIGDVGATSNTTYGLYSDALSCSVLDTCYGIYSRGYDYGLVAQGYNRSYGVLGVSSNAMPSNSAPGFGIAGIRTEDSGGGAGTIPSPGGRVGVLGYDSFNGTPGVAGVWAGSELSTALIANLLNSGTAIADFQDAGTTVLRIADGGGILNPSAANSGRVLFSDNVDIVANTLFGTAATIDFTNFDVSSAGLVTYAANGSVDNNAYVCKNSSNQLSTCNNGGGALGFVSLAPSSADADTSANPSIWINDTGGGNFLQFTTSDPVFSENVLDASLPNNRSDSVQQFVSPAWTDNTTEANSPGGAAYNLLDTGAQGADDGTYFSDSANFTALNFDIDTAGVAVTIVVEYCSALTVTECTGWTAVTGLVDNTSAYTVDGQMTWTDPGAAWLTGTVNGTNGKWLRIRSSTSPTTAPTAFFSTISIFTGNFLRFADAGSDRFVVNNAGTLTFSGVATDITAPTNEALTLATGGSGDINLNLGGSFTDVNINNVNNLILNSNTSGGSPSGIVINSPSNGRPGITFNDPGSYEDWLIEQFAGEFHIRNWSDSRNDIIIYDSGSIDLGAANVAKTINIGTGTGADIINIGTGDTSADTINIGNTDVITTINISSGMTTTTAVNIIANSITSGKGVDISVDGLTSGGVGLLVELTPSSASSPGSADLIRGVFTPPYGSDGTLSGNVLDLSRNASQNWSSGTLTVTGAVATISDNCGGVGTCTHSANILELNQQYASASGAVLNILNAGTGAGILFEQGTTAADGIQWGTDANLVNLYRSENDVLKTDDAFGVGAFASSTSTTEGTIYYDSDDDQLKVYANGKWQSDRTVATVIVGTSNGTSASRNYEKADYVCGASDCDTTIESAISALPTDGGVVYLLEGLYIVGSDGIDITKSNVSIIGAGRATILQRGWDAASNDGVITVGDGGTAVSGVTIADLSIDGVKATYIGTENIGIYFNQSVTYSTIRNTFLHDNDGPGIYLTVSTTTNNLIEGNDVRDNDFLAIYLDSSSNNTVAGNNVEGNSSFGIYLFTSSNNTVTGNNVEGGSFGIYLDSSSNNNTVAGNSVEGSSSYGIYLITSSNNTVTGNNVEGNGTYGIFLNVSSNNTVAGNNVEGNSSFGIVLNSSANNNNITGNKFHDNENDGIRISSSDENLISSNDITDTVGTSYAINVSDSGSDNNYLIGNRFSGTGASSIQDLGTGTTIQHRDEFEIESARTLGTLLSLGIPSSTTLTGALTGTNMDLSTNLTATGFNVTGQSMVLPAVTNTGAGTYDYLGLTVSAGGALEQNTAAGTTNWLGADINLPTITSNFAGSTITAYGLNLAIPDSAVTQTLGTAIAAGINIEDITTGPASGTLYGMNIGSIGTPGAGAETAINIGTGWDNVFSIGSAGGGTGNTQIASFAGTNTYTLPDSTGTFCLDSANCSSAYEVPLTFQNALTRTVNTVEWGGNLTNALTTITADATERIEISSNLGAARSTDVLTITQPNNVTFDSTGTLLTLNNADTGSSGAVLNVLGAGTGNLATLDTTNASANGVSIDIQSSSSSQYALNVTSGNNTINGLYVRADGNVGIGTTTPGAALEIAGNLLFTKEVARTLQIADSTTADTAGAALTIKGAAGAATNAAGGALNLTGGAGAGSEPGGALVFTAGAGGATGTGGAITITPGTAAGLGKPRGNITIGDSTAGGLASSGNTISIVASKGGNASPLTGGAGGSISLTTGAGGAGGGASPTGGAGGSFTVTAGAGGSANANAGIGGSITLTGGQGGGTSTSTGGSTTITSGAGGSNSGNSGALTLATGAVTSGSFGTISFKQGANFRMFIDANGNVGIGTETPDQELEVDGDIRLDANGGATTNGLCHSGADSDTTFTDRDIVACSAAESDIAEWYETQPGAEPGDIVMTTANTLSYQSKKVNALTGEVTDELISYTVSILAKTDAAYKDNIIGVVSTSPTQTIGKGIIEYSQNPQPIALVGRVPVKVSTEGGDIAPGDPLTSSSVPGVAMKATESGPIVGKALEAYSGADMGKILVFVSVGWYVAPMDAASADPLASVTDLSLETLTAGTIQTDVLFIGDRQLSMGPAGELIIDGSVNILGDVTITGDVDIDGILGATTLSAETIQIDIPEPDPDTGKSKATIGDDTLVAGETEIMIETTAVKTDSKIFVTATTSTGGQALVVIEKKAGESFTVNLDSPLPSDVTFDWWIVQVAGANSP